MRSLKKSKRGSGGGSACKRPSSLRDKVTHDAGLPCCHGSLATGCPVFAEPLEPRVLLSFVAHMSAQATGAVNANYAIDLTTTGDQASKWVVNWGDTHSDTFLASGQPGGQFGVPFSPTHQYAAGSYAITATSTSNSNSNVTSTTGFALNMNFGTSPFQQSGKTVDKPSGSTGNANGEAMVVDPSNGDIYVAAPYTPSGGGATVFSVSRYLPASSSAIGGVKDTSGFGSNGSVTAQALGGTTTEVDIPLAMIIDDRSRLYLAGKTTVNGVTTWGLAVFSGANSGSFTWGVTGTLPSGKSFPTGQANAIILDPTDHEAILVGSAAGGKMGVAVINPTTEDFDTSFNNGSPLSIATGSSGTATAYSVIDQENNMGNDELIVGGTTTYCQGSTSAGDFTFAEVDDTGTLDSNFGNQGSSYPGVYRLNFGNKLGVGHACNIPSLDSCYSLLEYSTVTTNDGFIAVGGSNALGGSSDSFALARFSMASSQPALDTHFGNHSDGLAIGMGVSGDAYTAVLDPNTNYILAAGSNLGNFEVARFTNATSSGGAVDNSFGFRGFETDFGSTSGVATDVARSIVIDTWSGAPLADVVVGGYTFTNSSNAQIALADYLPNNCVAIS